VRSAQCAAPTWPHREPQRADAEVARRPLSVTGAGASVDGIFVQEGVAIHHNRVTYDVDSSRPGLGQTQCVVLRKKERALRPRDRGVLPRQPRCGPRACMHVKSLAYFYHNIQPKGLSCSVHD
jgi:hypothetical protein